ncbi:hypothetical protein [Asticcacaulis taihuensis]|uniref:hypothetical protein n=1 Tax=Asticcacaulis taihuensis TaxID=260084 RepID=UPI0026F36B12|nr:hypothetical protein [Asticcacaulis taihuensis]
MKFTERTTRHIPGIAIPGVLKMAQQAAADNAGFKAGDTLYFSDAALFARTHGAAPFCEHHIYPVMTHTACLCIGFDRDGEVIATTLDAEGDINMVTGPADLFSLVKPAAWSETIPQADEAAA